MSIKIGLFKPRVVRLTSYVDW